MASLRLELRLERPKSLDYLIPVGSILLALFVGGLILVGTGTNPLAAYWEMFSEALGTGYGISETLVKATPLMLCGLGVMITFKMLFWNIGAEGQLHMGAFAATYVVLTGWEGSAWTMIPTMMLAGMVAGGVWALIPALLKVKLKVNEIITTLLMNYVAILWVDYLVYGPWKDPGTLNFPLTKQFPAGAQLLRFGDTRVHLGIIFAVVAAVILYYLQERSRWGFEIAVMGENPRAAEYAGMKTGRNVLLVMLISGGLSGLAGMVEVSAIQLRLLHGISPPNAPYGYTAIIVAWLARRNPWGVVLVSILLGSLYVGGEALQIEMRLPVNIVIIIQALILFFVLGGDILSRYRLVYSGWSPGKGTSAAAAG
ncbi:MAG: ABC transporter permease [Nitrospinota bacterium]|jgi:simple sugar transport system permease protein|nr:ABC transporter permease [Nitrospinota bacterium]